jgi:hypothetical protein
MTKNLIKIFLFISTLCADPQRTWQKEGNYSPDAYLVFWLFVIVICFLIWLFDTKTKMCNECFRRYEDIYNRNNAPYNIPTNVQFVQANECKDQLHNDCEEDEDD